MPLTIRRYQNEADYQRICAFLRQVFQLNGRRELSWQVCRLDYCRWHAYANITGYRPEEVIYLWETADPGDDDRTIAAVLNPEGPGDVYLQVHPHFRTVELENDLLAVAESQLAVSADGVRRLTTWAEANDDLRQALLQARGYTKGKGSARQRRRSLSGPIPAASIAPGYTIRVLAGENELPARSWVSWQAFHPDEPDDHYEGWEWYQNIQRAALYRSDLDLVAVAPDGTFAAFTTVWFDPVTQTGAFEPVGTAPAHQRLGLGKALMTDGLRRLKRLGARDAFVTSYTAPAHALYESVGFSHYDLFEPWEKTF